MTAVELRRRAVVRWLFWGGLVPSLALWLAPHVARADGAWLLAVLVLGALVWASMRDQSRVEEAVAAVLGDEMTADDVEGPGERGGGSDGTGDRLGGAVDPDLGEVGWLPAGPCSPFEREAPDVID